MAVAAGVAMRVANLFSNVFSIVARHDRKVVWLLRAGVACIWYER